MKNSKDYVSFVENYYTEKILAFGPTPQGVDWNGFESQRLRFKVQYELAKSHISSCKRILDFGCGYGEFGRYLLEQHFTGQYTGYDLVHNSIAIARDAFQSYPNFRFETFLESERHFDVLFGSGVFNVRAGDHQDWLNIYVKETLDFMVKFSDTLVLNFLKPNPTRPTKNLFFPDRGEVESILPKVSL